MYHGSVTLALVRSPCRPRKWTALNWDFKGKIMIGRMDLQKTQNEDSSLQMFKSWFNNKTGKIDTSTFDTVHSDVLQLYKVRKQLILTDTTITNSSRLIYLIKNEFDSDRPMRIVIPPSHRYQALLAIHVREHWGVQQTGKRAHLLATVAGKYCSICYRMSWMSS